MSANSTNIRSSGSLLSKRQKKDLQLWLEEYRKRWTTYWHHMDNGTVQHIINSLPVTIEQLSAVPGQGNYVFIFICVITHHVFIGVTGEAKARKNGLHILATIYAFLQSQDILHLFPEATEPSIEECPTWRDPFSEAAKEKRAADGESVTRTNKGFHQTQAKQEHSYGSQAASELFQPMDYQMASVHQPHLTVNQPIQSAIPPCRSNDNLQVPPYPSNSFSTNNIPPYPSIQRQTSREHQPRNDYSNSISPQQSSYRQGITITPRSHADHYRSPNQYSNYQATNQYLPENSYQYPPNIRNASPSSFDGRAQSSKLTSNNVQYVEAQESSEFNDDASFNIMNYMN